jgi:hypothetical protein
LLFQEFVYENDVALPNGGGITLPVSKFIQEKLPVLLRRYEISYCKEADCIEYFITDKKTHEQISYALVLSLNKFSKQINVGRFCPELYKEPHCKYLSAACFYLLIHHFAKIYHLSEGYGIYLETKPATYKKFFSMLKDFNLKVKRIILCNTAEVCDVYHQDNIDTSMVVKVDRLKVEGV